MIRKPVSIGSFFLHLLSMIKTSERAFRRRIFVTIFLMILMIFLRLSVPLFFKKVVLFLSQPNLYDSSLISTVLLGYGLCWVFDQAIIQVRTQMVFKLVEQYLHKVSVFIANSLFSLPLRFHLDRRTGGLTNHIFRAQSAISFVFWGFISFSIPTFVEMMLVIGLITCLYGWFYSSILFFIMTGYCVIGFIGMKQSLNAQKAHNEKAAHASSRLVDSLLNYETVKYFNNEKYEYEQIDAALSQQEQAGIKRFTIDGYIQLSQVMVIGIGLIIMTWLTGQAVLNAKMNISDFVLINGYLLQFSMPLNYLGSILYQSRKGLQDILHVYNLISQEPEVQNITNAINFEETKAEIVFDNVDFGYDPDHLILKRISFVVPAGKTVAIVGPTGSGKSTLVRLLFRLYDVSGGQILVNGQDIRTFSQNSYQQAIGVVSQETTLFNESLYYNIAYGNLKATKGEVERAIELAQLNDLIISTPDGYNTKVGERGLKLSGGEKQRVSIARAILRNPLIFVFDEATSSLDHETEREIQRNLSKISQQKTTLIITHRLSTVIHADRIFVINKGTIQEQGTHEELLEKRGIYSQLWAGYPRELETESLV